MAVLYSFLAIVAVLLASSLPEPTHGVSTPSSLLQSKWKEIWPHIEANNGDMIDIKNRRPPSVAPSHDGHRSMDEMDPPLSGSRDLKINVHSSSTVATPDPSTVRSIIETGATQSSPSYADKVLGINSLLATIAQQKIKLTPSQWLLLLDYMTMVFNSAPSSSTSIDKPTDRAPTGATNSLHTSPGKSVGGGGADEQWENFMKAILKRDEDMPSRYIVDVANSDTFSTTTRELPERDVTVKSGTTEGMTDDEMWEKFMNPILKGPQETRVGAETTPLNAISTDLPNGDKFKLKSTKSTPATNVGSGSSTTERLTADELWEKFMNPIMADGQHVDDTTRSNDPADSKSLMSETDIADSDNARTAEIISLLGDSKPSSTEKTADDKWQELMISAMKDQHSAETTAPSEPSITSPDPNTRPDGVDATMTSTTTTEATADKQWEKFMRSIMEGLEPGDKTESAKSAKSTESPDQEAPVSTSLPEINHARALKSSGIQGDIEIVEIHHRSTLVWWVGGGVSGGLLLVLCCVAILICWRKRVLCWATKKHTTILSSNGFTQDIQAARPSKENMNAFLYGAPAPLQKIVTTSC